MMDNERLLGYESCTDDFGIYMHNAGFFSRRVQVWTLFSFFDGASNDLYIAAVAPSPDKARVRATLVLV